MFYDTERIIRKQRKYEKIKAYEAISKLEGKGLSVSEMIDALDILLKDKNNEFQQSVLETAKSILVVRKEADDEELTDSSSDDANTNWVCPVVRGVEYSRL